MARTSIDAAAPQWYATDERTLRILGGMPAGQIPIVANNRRDIWVNFDIISAAGMELPKDLVRKAKRVTGLESKS